MAIQSPAEVAKAAEILQKDSQKSIDEAKKTLAEYKKKSGEFETIRGGLIEGSSMIVAHVKELETMYVTFDKMTTKLDVIRKEMEMTGKTLRGIQKPVIEAITDSREIVKDADKLIPINKGNALLLGAKKSMETLANSLVDTKEKIEVAAGDCEGLPGQVARPKGM